MRYNSIYSFFLISISTIFSFNKDTFQEFSKENVYVESYAEIKAKIELERSTLKNKTISKDSISEIFTRNLVDYVFPYWYGTKWSFEGHTSIPKNGEVACGYFVSTTLRDIGLAVNRYKLAQQLPVNEAYSLAVLDSVRVIKHKTSVDCQEELYRVLKEGIYFIGFDKSHVGFIFKKDNQLYIIDSNFFSGEVQKEGIETSKVFHYFSTFYITPLSTNESLLEKWINKKEIKVVTSHQ
ncbi:hypothetical protein [Flavobacterium sp. J27]|uniref:hypothetical protein n=1 Tax=Flavobacterium sp. J27 TaxID=2060419 RepID=UPI001030BB03|nr:hypothetical protein [Flavobacterium sp. J27]